MSSDSRDHAASGRHPLSGRTRLTQLGRDRSARFVGLDGDPADAASLRAMGLRPNCRVVVRRLGEPCILEVGGCSGCVRRIGVNRFLAERIMVASGESECSEPACDGPARTGPGSTSSMNDTSARQTADDAPSA